MRQIISSHSIFEFPESDNEAVCIPTNGMVNKIGDAVMGKGLAKEANILFNLSHDLGKKITNYGNIPFDMGIVDYNGKHYRVFTFPTKDDWRDNSNIAIIVRSATELVKLCNVYGIKKCYVPMVGCGCGGMKWVTVSAVLSNILDNRFIAIVRRSYEYK